MEHSALGLIAMVAVGVAAGFINVMAGGGSLFAIPALIMLGLPDTVANGTVRIAVLVQTATAVTRFSRGGGALDWRLTARLALPTLAGAAIGAWIAAHMSDGVFRKVLIGTTLCAAALLVFQPFLPSLSSLHTRRAARPLNRWIVAVLMFGVGIYGGMIQAAVGFLLLAVLGLGVGLPLLQANVQKVAIVLCYTPLALGMFLSADRVDVPAGLALAAGQAAGAWISAGMALRHGAPLMRKVLAVALIIAVVKLLYT